MFSNRLLIPKRMGSLLGLSTIFCLLPSFALEATAEVLYSSEMTAPPFVVGNLAGQNGWSAHSGSGSVPIQVGTTGTTLIHGAGSREDVGIGFTEISAGQTYYYGFDVQVDGGSNQVYFAHFKASGFDATTRTFVTSHSAGDFTFGLSATNDRPDLSWGAGLSFGQTYRIIGAYSRDTRENRLWVDPIDEASFSLALKDTNSNAVSAFALRQSSGNSNQLITNLAVGTSFAEVLGRAEAATVPEPTTLFLAATGIGAVSLARRWMR